MKKDIHQNGWNEYSKLVLAELERLNENDEKGFFKLSFKYMYFLIWIEYEAI